MQGTEDLVVLRFYLGARAGLWPRLGALSNQQSHDQHHAQDGNTRQEQERKEENYAREPDLACMLA